MEGGVARAGEILPALTSTGEIVLHLHHCALTGEVVLIDNTNSHIPNGDFGDKVLADGHRDTVTHLVLLVVPLHSERYPPTQCPEHLN